MYGGSLLLFCLLVLCTDKYINGQTKRKSLEIKHQDESEGRVMFNKTLTAYMDIYAFVGRVNKEIAALYELMKL